MPVVVGPAPSVDQAALALAAPDWVSGRGGDCRAYDRRSMREVFGPAHPFAVTTDCVVTNGIVQGWVGNRGLQPFLHVRALADSLWHEVGTIPIGRSTDRLLGARLTRVTPDATTLALAVAGLGEALVTLKGGERMFHCEQPAGLNAPDWSGIPPASRAVLATNGEGRFGNGLDATDGAVDLRLLWPPYQAQQRFGRALWHRPAVDVGDVDIAGVLTVYNTSGVAVIEVYLDGADAKIKVRVNDVERLVSSPLTFVAGDDLAIGLRFAVEDGLGLSIRHADGGVEHLSLPSLVDLGDKPLHQVGYYVNFARWGDGSWGDGVWGGVTHYPGGVIDNDMLFDGWVTEAEFETLVAGTYALDGLPRPYSRLVGYAPFDAEPLPAMSSAFGSGRSVDPTTDAAGFQKMIGFLDNSRRRAVAALARDATHERPSDLHDQAAAAAEQTFRLR